MKVEAIRKTQTEGVLEMKNLSEQELQKQASRAEYRRWKKKISTLKTLQKT